MRLRLTYYPDITQHRTPAEVEAAVRVFADALAAELAVVIDVLPVVGVREQTCMIAAGGCEIGLLKPSSYVLAHRSNADVLPAAVALRVIDGKPGDTYFAQVYANRQSGITTLDDLARRCGEADPGRRPAIAFGDPFSTANFLVPAARLAELKLHPFTRFRSARFCGGHDGAARAVYAGECDVGAGHDGTIIDLARQPGYADAADRLVRLDRVFIHSDPVAVNVDAGLRQRLSAALLVIARADAVKQALDVFWGAVVGLGPTRHENYDSVAQAITRLNLAEDDILV